MYRIICIFSSLFLIFLTSRITAQTSPPEPCTSGSQNTCQCETSPILCTPDILSNYEYDMTNYLHQSDGPDNPMCMPGGNGTTAHNPTWFRFIALCEDLQMTVTTTGCSNGGSGWNPCRGVQLAVFPECEWQNPWDAVACQVNQCITSGSSTGQVINLTMSGLTIGKLYSLVVDGCCNSFCNVHINITTPPCFPNIEPWQGEIQGPKDVCVGDDATYCVENVTGGLKYIWTLDGTLVDAGPADDSGTTCMTNRLFFNQKGTYTLCVDTENSCVPVTDNPPPNCITITVHDTEAGTITANPTPTCPGSNVNINVTGNATDAGLSQYIVIVDASGTVVQVTPGTTGSFTWPECATFTAYSYNYVTVQQPVPQVGDNFATVTAGCSEDYKCCDFDSVDIVFEDNDEPVILNVPADITVDCYESIPAMADLSFTDNCMPGGTVAGVQTGTYTDCSGGAITRTWTVEDSCGNIATSTQTITIDPIPVATFTPFDDVTVSCEMFPLATFLPPLTYTNSKTGGCLIAGTIIPTRVVDTMQCMGTVTYNWMATDKCNRVIQETQVYTVEPPDEAAFINPPADVTVSCSNFPVATYLPPLSYTNGSTGICLVAGTIIPYQVVDTSACEGTVTFVWQGLDKCGRVLNHQQVWTVEPPQEISFINPPPAQVTVDCANIPPAGTLPPLSYTNGEPAGRCRIQGSVIPTRIDMYDICGGTIDFLWSKTDSCGRSIAHSQTMTVNPAPEPQWVNPPADITLPCGQTVDPAFMPDLFYSNGVPNGNFCSINGSVAPTRQNDIQGCSGTVTFTWTYTDPCGRTLNHTQVYTLSPPDEPQWINPPADITVTSCSGYDFDNLPMLSYNNGQTGPDCGIMGSVEAVRTGSVTDCQGAYIYTWTYTDKCDREYTHIQTVTVIPPPEAAFVNPPASQTVTCENKPDGNAVNLNYTNGGTGACLISGTISATPQIQDNNDCSKVYTYEWEFTDNCNRTISHTQTVNVDPPLVAQWINPPADITVASCDNFDFDNLPMLTYNNGQSGDCAITGSAEAVRTGSITDCQGAYVYTWTFSDNCNRTITHTRTVNVVPPPAPQWVNPPADITVASCDNFDFDDLPELFYNNGGTGLCAITGSVEAVRTGSVTDCQGAYVYTWTFTDNCNRTITHTRTVTVVPPPAAQFINPPVSETLNCNAAPDPNAAIVLSYSNNGSGNCLINGSIPATPQVQDNNDCSKVYTYEWTFTDNCNRTITHTKVTNVLPPPPPVFINPPADITLSCSAAPDLTQPQVLNYNNNATGSCAISGSVNAVINSNTVNCTGTHQLTWEFTDNCGRTIQWNQTITVNPPAEPSFVNAPPAVSSVTCENEPDPSDLPVLHYTNSDSGDCLIEGDVVPTLDIVENGCDKTYTYNWRYTDMCSRNITYTRVVNVSPPPPATFINPPVYTTMTCSNAETFTAPDLQYSNNSSCDISGTIQPVVTNNFNACGGNININWTGRDICGRTLSYSQIIVVLPAPPPVFTSTLPDDITVSCQELSAYQVPLDYSNSQDRPCNRDGSVFPVLDASKVTLCGGIATLTWQVTDLCGLSLQHVQHITVEPAPAAVFLNPPPATETVSCTDVPSAPPALNYSNGESGSCGINGSVTPIQTGGYNACGGTIQYTWQFTDACGRSIVYTQNVIVLPADEPYFTTEPDDAYLPCNQGFPAPYTLTYTNGLSGNCAINGTVMATYEDAGIVRTFTWTYTNNCTGNVITTNQEVTISPVPNIVADPVVVNVCFGDYFNLEDIQVTDLNGTNIDLTYHYGTPASVNNQMSSPPWVTVEGSYYILATNEYGCTDEVEIKLKNDPPPQSGYGKSTTLCSEGSTVNLWTLLDPPYDNNGYWSDEYGHGIDVSNPANVNLDGLPGGTYNLFYIVSSNNSCPDGMTSVEINLVDPGNYEILNVTCSGDFSTYTVVMDVYDYTVTASAGNITKNGPTVTISNIPIGTSVVLTFKSVGGLCGDETLTIDPPQCNCPNIPNPVSGGNIKACQNQTGVTLSVTVGSGLTAQWFSAQTGGTLLKDKSLTYNPPTDVVGIKTYYVQAIDTLTDCKSQRIAVQLEVVANPVVTNAVLNVCDDDKDGIAVFNLDDAKTKVVSGGGFTFSYHLTLTDAQNETNPLPNTYTNTSNNQKIYVVVKNSSGCKSIAEVTLSVWALPNVTFTVTHEKCSGNNNGSILVNPPTTGLEFKLNNLPWSANPLMENLQPGNYTILVRDGNKCVASYQVTINAGQKLSFGTFTINCNNKGTLSDGNDDTYDIVMNVTSVPTASGNTYTIVYNGQTLGANYSYGVSNSMSIPADGTSGQIEITDNVTGCKVTRNIGPLIACSTNCAIDLANVSVVCDNKGTDSDPTDDTYTISFVATAVNNGSSTTFTLLIDNVIRGTYNYGEVVTITLPADGSTPDIRIRDAQNIQCFTTLDAGTLNSCSGTCQITAVVSKVTCGDNGTINDPNDDTFTFTIRVTGNNISSGWKISGSTDVYAYNTNVILGPYPISGGNLSLNIEDIVDGNCKTTVPVTAPAPCSTPCVLEVADVTVFPCDNNNTGNTSADDVFKVTFKVNAVSGSVNFYNVTYNGKTYGPFTYGQIITIDDLPANGQNLTLSVVDAVNGGCVTSLVVKQDPCSSCPQTVDAGADKILTCTNNTATLTATASHQGGVFVWTGPNGFNKSGQTVTTSTEGEYTVTVTFPDQCVATDKVLVSKDANLPVANAGTDQELTCIKKDAVLTGSSNLSGNVTYTWTNAAGTVIGNTATITVTGTGFYYLEVTNTLNNCKSGKDEVEVFDRNQQLKFVTNSWICSNKGTATIGDDDEYTYTFNLSNTTSATNKYKVMYQGSEIGSYNYNQSYSLTLPADGSTRIYVFVDEVTGCMTSTTIGPLEPCSTDCELTIEDLTVICNDNGTESIDTDDYYEVEFKVTGINTGSSGTFVVTKDGVQISSQNYGSKLVFKFPADGTIPFIVVRDKDINGCQVVLNIPQLNPCSSKCDIEATVSNVLCNDNGTINDPADDIFYFDVVVTGLNISSGWKVQGSATLNDYGKIVTMGPYPISGGIVNLNIADNKSANCTETIKVTPPAVCSEPCVIRVDNLIIFPCNNNNTGPVTTDDIFSVSFVVNRQSGSAKHYNVTAGSRSYGPFNYGTIITIDSLPANGQDIRLIIKDPTNNGCQTEVTVKQQPCSNCTQTADAGADQLITCQSNVVTLTGTATTGGTFVWTGPNGFNKSGQTVTTSTAGKYYLTVTYPDKCIARDSVIVNKDASVPDAFGGLDQTLTCIVGEVVLTGTTSNQSSTLKFVWTNEQGIVVSNNSIFQVNSPGTYYFEVINTENGCSSGKDEIVVRENVTLPDATIIADPGNLIDCIIGTVQLSGKPIANVIFNWNTGEAFIANQPSIIVNKEGTVTMIAVDTINGCENTAKIDIIDLQDYPILVTKPALPITCVNNGVYVSAGLSPEGPNLVFTWYDGKNKLIAGESKDSLYVTNPGTYYVVLTDTLNGCSNRDTFVVNRIGDFPVVQVSDDIQLYCGVTNTTLKADIIKPNGATTLTWSSQNGNIVSPTNQSVINVNSAGIYVVEVVYNASGCKTTENVNVLVDTDYPTEVRAIVDDESCKNEKDGSITIDFISGGKEPIQYSLNNGQLTSKNTFSPINPGRYNLRVVDANGCTLDTVIVVNPGYEVNLFAISPLELIYKESRVIELITNLKPDEIASIKWSPSDNLSCDDCLITTMTGLTDVTYIVEITDIHGCTQSVRIAVRIKDNSIITVPNIIDPKSGVNQYFSIFANESVISVDKLAVYDRWGNLVFIKEHIQPNIPNEGWNGTLNGRAVEQGVYVYIIHYTTPSGAKILTGDVTVMR